MLGTRAGNTVRGTKSGHFLACGKGVKSGLARKTQNAKHVALWQCLPSMREDQSSVPSTPNKTKDGRCRLCLPQVPMPQFP